MLEKMLLIPTLLFGGGGNQSSHPPNFGKPAITSEKVIERRCPKERVKEIYAKLLNELAVDEEVGNSYKGEERDPIGKIFQSDVDVTKKLKKGNCRQISHRLFYDLYKICSQVYILVIENRDGSSHIAVMYVGEDGQKYVADLSGESKYCEWYPEMFKRNEPKLYGIPLEKFIEKNKDEILRIEYVNESPISNKKSFGELNFVPLYPLYNTNIFSVYFPLNLTAIA